MAGLLDELGHGFVRVHRGFVVNSMQVARIERSQAGTFLLVQSGTRVKVGRTYLKDVEQYCWVSLPRAANNGGEQPELDEDVPF